MQPLRGEEIPVLGTANCSVEHGLRQEKVYLRSMGRFACLTPARPIEHPQPPRQEEEVALTAFPRGRAEAGVVGLQRVQQRPKELMGPARVGRGSGRVWGKGREGQHSGQNVGTGGGFGNIPGTDHNADAWREQW